VSARGAASISTRPEGLATRSFGGSGVANSYLTADASAAAGPRPRSAAGAGRACRLSPRRGPWVSDTASSLLLSALPAPGQPAGDLRGGSERQAARERLDDPGVQRDPVLGGGRLQRGLQGIRQPQRDPGGQRRLLAGRLGGGLVGHVHERRLLAGEPELDMAAGELGADLERGLGQQSEE